MLHVYPGIDLRALTQDAYRELLDNVRSVLQRTSPLGDESEAGIDTDVSTGPEASHIPPYAQKLLKSFQQQKAERRAVKEKLAMNDAQYRQRLDPRGGLK